MTTSPVTLQILFQTRRAPSAKLSIRLGILPKFSHSNQLLENKSLHFSCFLLTVLNTNVQLWLIAFGAQTRRSSMMDNIQLACKLRRNEEEIHLMTYDHSATNCLL